MTVNSHNFDQGGDRPMELIGLIPAAGTASRLSPLAGSKEILPVGVGPTRHQPDSRPKVCCQYLLERMQSAGAEKAFIVIRDGKWDIPSCLGNGSSLDISLAYLMMNAPFGVPFTLDQAYSFVKDAVILFGFPDILFYPENAFGLLRQRQKESRADIVLGLFEADDPASVDMVHLGEDGHIAGIEIKNPASKARYSWIIALWTPVFTQYLHCFVTEKLKVLQQPDALKKPGSEIYMGAVIADAIQDGLTAVPLMLNNGRFLDIGTPENLLRAPEFALRLKANKSSKINKLG
jgi:glucose-1-phosphate thymidylyltransferase